jgi:hypothetical protein
MCWFFCLENPELRERIYLIPSPECFEVMLVFISPALQRGVSGLAPNLSGPAPPGPSADGPGGAGRREEHNDEAPALKRGANEKQILEGHLTPH